MALELSPIELLFLDAMVKDRIEKLDDSLDVLRRAREALGEPVSEEEGSIALVRAIHTTIGRKVALELDVPFQVPPQRESLAELLS